MVMVHKCLNIIYRKTGRENHKQKIINSIGLKNKLILKFNFFFLRYQKYKTKTLTIF